MCSAPFENTCVMLCMYVSEKLEWPNGLIYFMVSEEKHVGSNWIRKLSLSKFMSDFFYMIFTVKKNIVRKSCCRF